MSVNWSVHLREGRRGEELNLQEIIHNKSAILLFKCFYYVAAKPGNVRFPPAVTSRDVWRTSVHLVHMNKGIF